MKNILQEKAATNLHGRLLASVKFVNEADVANKEILDIGCGFGWCELNFFSRGAKKITAMEVSVVDLSVIRQQVNDPRLTTVVGSACELPFPDESFDTVVAWEVIEHIPKNKESLMFKEVSRVLRPGGHFYLSTPNNSFSVNFFDPAWYFGHRHYSLGKLRELSLRYGFKIGEIKVVGGFWVILSILDLYFSKWVLHRKRMFYKFFDEMADKEFSKNGIVNIFINFQKDFHEKVIT